MMQNNLLIFLALLRYLTEDKIDHRVALTIAFRIQCLVDEYNDYEVYSNKESIYKVAIPFHFL